MAESTKKKRGRPPKKSAADKEAERMEKETSAKTAVDYQSRMDTQLLRVTSKENPFRHSLNKRKESWCLIAGEMTDHFKGETFDDRRCRERVKVLMKARRIDSEKKVTGVGSLVLSEVDTLLNSLIEQEDFTTNNASAEKEKEEQSKVLVQTIQKDALATIKKRTVLINESDTADEQDGGSPVRKKPSPKKLHLVAPYKKRKTEPVDEYLELKKAQQVKELEIKLEMHRETMLDNAAERSVRRELLEFDRDKLRMEDAEKAR
ncbi:hypothetical protein RvY_18595 [Ramazzottius varieornatus]|uniref:Uncharacterized protein n=1 Tax=Ramazzottius varieornatus TaxID=947166 RepID=A0A1D1W7U5_RAMVA|nr:hypothetical protein RvY_18595 [Ramazzottius varieornatus]